MTESPGTPTPLPNDAELLAYLDETLSLEKATQLEKLFRARPDLRARVALLTRWRDQGGDSVGEIWKRRRLSCLSRSQLGRYLLLVASPDLRDYIEFHLNTMECRFCRANLEDLEDLKASQAAAETAGETRQRRYFESSAGLLRSQSFE